MNLIENFFQILLTPVLSFAFWAIVTMVWICVKCSVNRFGYLLCYWFAIALICMISVGATVILTWLGHLLDLDSLAVEFNILLAKKELAKCRTWKNKITLLQTKSVCPIKLRFGLFGWLGNFFS